MRSPSTPSRTFFSLVLSLFLASCAAAQTPTPCPPSPWMTTLDHPQTPTTHRAAAEELFELLQIQRTYETGIEDGMRRQLESNPRLRALETPMREFFRRYASFAAVRERFLQLYLDTYNELELRQMSAFYRSNVGRRSIRELPDLMHRGGEIGRTQVQEHQAELEQMIRQYLVEHPPQEQ